MKKPTIRIHDLETNEIIDREMNDTEFEFYKEKQAQIIISKSEAEAKATQKAALLERLGITEAEARLLLG
jgi:predicted metal-binding transcription factor (methanogenesis marker protein 9)